MKLKSQINPHVNVHIHPKAIINGKIQQLQKTLQQLLSVNPFPISQDPVVTRSEDKKTVAQVIQAKTIFTHSETQACALWASEVLGTAAWTDNRDEGTYVVTQPDQNIQGVSNTRDMSMVFSCQLLKCVIESHAKSAECLAISAVNPSILQTFATVETHSAELTHCG